MGLAKRSRVHLDENAVAAFLGGELPLNEASGVRAHLDGCADCVELVGAVVGVHARIATGSAPTRPARSHALLERGAIVGPYVIESVLGAGGMGVVYAARDPRLDRTVALKLLRPELGSAHEIVERLRRESKALARLSHPNVTAVFELGSVDDLIYVAMEYIAGTTLGAWIHDKRPIMREIVDVFGKAGLGLAAAHAAGLVHRDFKPDNVLLGTDGSVKVSDFGLARRVSEPDAEPGSDRVEQHELTQAGAVIGTPAYMAPEQLAGGAIDARADQFSFCVALYEALYGVRPFRGGSFDELRASVLAGVVDDSGSGPLHRAILRGLARDPAARFADMDALLVAIKPRRPFVVRATIAATLAAAAATAAVVLTSPSAAPSCQGAAAELEPVWNALRRATLQQSFLAANPHSAGTWSTVDHALDRYATSWAVMHRGACEATRVRHEQSEAVLDLRMGCLERQRSQFEALLDVLAHPDKATIAHAPEAAGALTDTRACGDVQALLRGAPVPTDVVEKARYDALRVQIDRGRALVNVSHYKDALPVLDVDATRFPLLDADAQFVRAKVLTVDGAFPDAEKALFRALSRAQAAHADDLTANTAVDLAYVLGIGEQRFAEGYRWADFAASAIEAKGGDVLLGARLADVRANIFVKEGKLGEAEAAQRKALALATQAEADGLLVGELSDSLGTSLAMQGKFDEAVPVLQKALAIRQRFYGDLHSLTASTRMNLANALSTSHRESEAIVQFHAALAADEAIFGPDGYELSSVLGNLGQALQGMKQFAEAQTDLERGLAIRVKALGAAHPSVARMHANLGYLFVDEENFDRAIAEFAAAGTIVDAALGPDNIARADDLEGIGLAWIGKHRPAKAIAPLERALALRQADAGDPVELAGLQARLAQALWQSGNDKARATKLGHLARPVLVDAGEHDQVLELDAWMPH